MRGRRLKPGIERTSLKRSTRATGHQGYLDGCPESVSRLQQRKALRVRRPPGHDRQCSALFGRDGT